MHFLGFLENQKNHFFSFLASQDAQKMHFLGFLENPKKCIFQKFGIPGNQKTHFLGFPENPKNAFFIFLASQDAKQRLFWDFWKIQKMHFSVFWHPRMPNNACSRISGKSKKCIFHFFGIPGCQKMHFFCFCHFWLFPVSPCQPRLLQKATFWNFVVFGLFGIYVFLVFRCLLVFGPKKHCFSGFQENPKKCIFHFFGIPGCQIMHF